LTTQTVKKHLHIERTTKTNTTTPPKRGATASDPGSIISKKLLLYKDARVHYVVLKQQPHHTRPTHPTHTQSACATR